MENSRRQVIQAALVAIPAIGALKALAADKAPVAAAKPPAPATFRMSKNNLGHLTNALYNSPAERQKFLADPKGYSETLFRAKLDPADANKLGEIQKMFADGFCCGGCGCGMPVGAEIQVAR
jgi:hypothetical protein